MAQYLQMEIELDTKSRTVIVRDEATKTVIGQLKIENLERFDSVTFLVDDQWCESVVIR